MVVLCKRPTRIRPCFVVSAIDRMIDELYNRIEEDPGLRPMFPRTLTNERMKQHALADFRIR